MTSHEWGRVDSDGTVYVRTADGERSVGQYPEGTPEDPQGARRRKRLDVGSKEWLESLPTPREDAGGEEE